MIEGMSKITAQSRVRILDAPATLPGHCAMCRASRSDDRKYIDIGLQVDLFGTVIFCTMCIGEIASAAGFAPVESINSLVGEFYDLKDEHQKLSLKYGVLANAFAFCYVDGDNSRAGVDELVSRVEDSISAQNSKPRTNAAKSTSNKASSG